MIDTASSPLTHWLGPVYERDKFFERVRSCLPGGTAAISARNAAWLKLAIFIYDFDGCRRIAPLSFTTFRNEDISMSTSPVHAILATSVMCAIAACSQDASTTQPGTAARSASNSPLTAAVASTGNAPANPCDHTIAASDIVGILVAPATRNAGLDPATCVYRTRAKANVTISAAKGDAAKGAWMLATTYNATTNRLPGVGDEALYDSEGTTLIARKGDTSCRVDVVGADNADAMDDITKARGEELARKLGALCDKIFADRG